MADISALLAQALAFEREGRAGEARTAYERVLDADAGHPGALLKLGLFALAAGRVDDARLTLERALAAAIARGIKAGPVWIALAEVARAQGNGREAARSLAEAIALEPGNVRLRLLHAEALRMAGDVKGAVGALASGTDAVPQSVDAWLALGGLLMEIELARSAARDDPVVAALPRALAAFDRALALAPGVPGVLAAAAMAFRYACEWARAEQCMAGLRSIASDATQPFAVSPVIAAALIEDAKLQHRAIRDFSRGTLPPARQAQSAPAFVRSPGTRLRVGYLGSDFHEHATAHLAAGLFEHHDRERVETFAYALDRDDGSEMRKRLVRAFGQWRDMRTLRDEAVAARIAQDGIDVLVDLKGHTHGSRLGILAHRPAPAQIHYLGFPGTLAYAAIDALVADAIVVPPDAERDYAERILRMPVCYQVNDRDRALPPAASRASVGLPERALVLASFNQTYKLERSFVETWLDILVEHPQTVLWLSVPQALARDNLRAAALARGISAERIVFAPFAKQAEHLARLRCADLALDVLPYGSHTTGSDALWCGVPLLTVRGSTFAGRVGASLLNAVGLPQLVTDSIEAYRMRLEALVRAPAELAACREHLERGRATFALFDTERFARDFERLLEHAANGTG